MSKIPEFYIGCDPEIFLEDAAGAYVSVIGKIGGSKAYPRPLPLGDGFAVQEDNVALEFNIPPASEESEFVDSINMTKKFLSNEVNRMGLRFSQVSACLFPQHELAHPMALTFGCDPDWNAWKRKKNVMPKFDDGDGRRLRSAGGHVHVGYKFHNLSDRFKFVKHMDLFLGVPSVIQDSGLLRKKLYGGAGACRPKEYGVEYRTLSNYWVFDDDLIRWVYKATQDALTAYDKRLIDIDAWGDNIQAAINTDNIEIARSLVDHFDLRMA